MTFTCLKKFPSQNLCFFKEYMSEMQFVEEINELEQVFEQHKVDHRDIFDFRHEVDNCIALQVMN